VSQDTNIKKIAFFLQLRSASSFHPPKEGELIWQIARKGTVKGDRPPKAMVRDMTFAEKMVTFAEF